MTRIDFYVGQTNSLRARLVLAGKLVEKAYQRGMHVYIHTDSVVTSQRIDDYLWTLQDNISFIPHALASSQDHSTNILIGHDFEPMQHCDLLINLSNSIPAFFARFERLAEVLDQEESVLLAGRQRYQFYRDRGYTLNYHQLNQ